MCDWPCFVFPSAELLLPPSRYAAPGASLLYLPIAKTSGLWQYWRVILQHVVVNGTHFGGTASDLCGAIECTAILDTGTSYIAVGESYYSELITMVRNCPRGQQ